MALLWVSFSMAQWNSDTNQNTLVAESKSMTISAEGTTTGETYVVYWKQVPGPENFELRMQLLDADGNRTLGEDGSLISDEIPMGTHTVLASAKVDSANNLYVAVTGTGGGNPLFVYKMDKYGNALWDLEEALKGSGNKPVILPLSSGEAVVSWMDPEGTVLQKFNTEGEPLWNEPVLVDIDGAAIAPDVLFELSDGGFIGLIHKLSYGINSTLFAQRFDANGNPVWENAVQLSDGSTTWNRYYDGFVEDDVVYIGYFSSFGVRFDSFVQRINPDGSLPWGINGSDFDTSQDFYEMETSIATNPGSDFIWALSRYTNSTQGEVGTYIQKFDKETGQRQFTDNAKEIFEVGSEKKPDAKIQILDGYPIFLIRDGFDNGVSPIDLLAVMLDENGDFYWEEETRPVATYDASKGRVHFLKPVDGQAVTVFEEDKGNGERIFAQNLI